MAFRGFVWGEVGDSSLYIMEHTSRHDGQCDSQPTVTSPRSTPDTSPPRHQSPRHQTPQTPAPPPDTAPRHWPPFLGKGGGLLSWTYNDTRPPSKNEYWGKPLSSTTHDTSNRRRGKREAVLPPLHTLAAYTSQKSFISLDLKQHPGVREKFLPLSGEKGWKRGGFLFRGKKGESWLR